MRKEYFTTRINRDSYESLSFNDTVTEFLAENFSADWELLSKVDIVTFGKTTKGMEIAFWEEEESSNDYIVMEIEVDRRRHFVTEFEGKEYMALQDAYITQDGRKVIYEATTLGEDGNMYKMQWCVVDGHETMEDEADHCDWENPYGVIEW